MILKAGSPKRPFSSFSHSSPSPSASPRRAAAAAASARSPGSARWKASTSAPAGRRRRVRARADGIERARASRRRDHDRPRLRRAVGGARRCPSRPRSSRRTPVAVPSSTTTCCDRARDRHACAISLIALRVAASCPSASTPLRSSAAIASAIHWRRRSTSRLASASGRGGGGRTACRRSSRSRARRRRSGDASAAARSIASGLSGSRPSVASRTVRGSTGCGSSRLRAPRRGKRYSASFSADTPSRAYAVPPMRLSSAMRHM